MSRYLRYLLSIALPALVLAQPPIALDEVIVSPSKFGVVEDRTTAGATLTGAELEALPQVGDDLFRSIARLPGLAGDDFSAKFWVRGAPNRQLLVRYDGVDLIEPFHLKDVDGALSIVDPQTIEHLDLTTGGFTAEYGDRLAGVLALESKQAASSRTSLGLSLTGLAASNQGSFHGAQGRWLVAARRGYPDIALRVAGRDDEVTPRYYDATAQVSYSVAPSHTFSIHALHAGDTLTYRRTNSPSLSSRYGSDYLWGRWEGRLASGVKGETVASYSRLTWNRLGYGSLDGFPFALHDQRKLGQFATRSDWSAAWGDSCLVRAGAEAKTGEGRYDYSLNRQHSVVAAGRQTTVTEVVNTELAPTSTSTGLFAAVRLKPTSLLVIEPGIRYDRQSLTSDSNVSPRFNATFNLGPAVLRGAWGVYRQSQGLHELAVADGEKNFGRAEFAEHRIIGLEFPLGTGISARAEAYERVTTRVRPRWENLDNGYDLFPEAQADRVRLAPNRGRARGAELLLAGHMGSRLAWHVSYGLSRTEERLAGVWTPRSRDQRHSFYSDFTYAPNSRWQFSASWQYHSGWPTTDVVYSFASLSNGRRVLVSANGAVYGLRLPDYHRLDLRLTRRFTLKRGELRAYLDVFNAYDRTNLIGYEHRVTVSGTQVTDMRKPREQLPFLPSAGLNWAF